MWSIVGLVGLAVSFVGAAVLTYTAIKSEGKILNEAAPRLPVGGPPGSEEYEKSLRNSPNVQALLRQSRVAKWGLGILTFGFAIQFIGGLGLFIYP
jgi:hypothetical protein